MTSLQIKLRTAMMSDAGLSGLLGSGSALRFYKSQLVQGTAFPAMTGQRIYDSPTYVVNGRLQTSFQRVQFSIFALTAESAEAVLNALTAFLDTFTAYGLQGTAYKANRIITVKDGGIALTDPLTYQIFADAYIRNDDTI